QFLLSNEQPLVGEAIQLEGVFKAGDKLHFAFDIVEPEAAADEVFKSNKQGDRKQFSYDKQNHLYAIDDTRRGTPGFDGDYNDLIVRLTFSQVPEPGSIALMGLSGML